LPENLVVFDAEFLPHFIKMVPVLFSSSGILLAIFLYGISSLSTVYGVKMSYMGNKFYNFFNRKWFFDKVYNEYINQSVLHLGYEISYKTIDRGLIENLGPHGLSNLFYNRIFNILQFQTGLLYHYTFVLLVGLVLLLTSLGFVFSISFTVFILFFFIIIIFLVNVKR
jgi:NADH-ubiquinone oxidoreductase chain 5